MLTRTPIDDEYDLDIRVEELEQTLDYPTPTQGGPCASRNLSCLRTCVGTTVKTNGDCCYQNP
ncbi:hypothetical protein [Fodinicola acaciae]|uniref:hypothetical protein n=1 Tax=Fodinicola acaciae TaxID=2681555 RepID=UPI0013D3D47C|nr:hypothetical protein [Fodinicola acaciae]